ncbi:FkbM family methyltransferase [Nocardia aurea]|uniref:FkbM family methyltransferase n=1 Tax=Nocardia aurea TaxID=2144174 RepID=UPI0013002646|nr:FkbM family methyltransferase [Nocardia aurea]
MQTVVDLGANIGLSATYFSELFPDAKILCIEPLAENQNVLRVNARKNWKLISCAISGEDGSASFGVSKWWGSGSIVDTIWRRRQALNNRFESTLAMAPRKVAAVTLDTLIAEHNIDSIDVLKMDIEGAEESVFAGSLNWLHSVRVLLIEIHDKYVDSNRIREILKARRFIRVGLGSPMGCEVYVNGELAVFEVEDKSD